MCQGIEQEVQIEEHIQNQIYNYNSTKYLRIIGLSNTSYIFLGLGCNEKLRELP